MPVLHLVEAFATDRFTGNPAAVCVLDAPAAEDWMQRVAREMNLSETAYLHPIAGGYSLRWFTQSAEVRLCGHATLASAFTLWATGVLPPDAPARFQTLSGWLVCTPADGWVAMDFPAQPCAPCTPPAALPAALGCAWDFCGSNGTDYLVEVRDAATVRALRPDFGELAAIPARGFIVTSRSDWPAFDFISRFFAPAVGVDEDPVTGSAHCTLAPYWAGRLGRTRLRARQVSARGGEIDCTLVGDRVRLAGEAVLYLRGEILV